MGNKPARIYSANEAYKKADREWWQAYDAWYRETREKGKGRASPEAVKRLHDADEAWTVADRERREAYRERYGDKVVENEAHPFDSR